MRRTLYIAIPPSQAVSLLGKRELEKAESIAQAANRLAKQLEDHYGGMKLSANTGAVFYSGRQGARDLIDRVLREQADLYWIGPSKMFIDLDQNLQREIFQRLSVKRMDNGTTAFAISDAAFRDSFYFHGGSSSFRRLRTTESLINTSALIVVTGSLCAFVKSFGSSAEAVSFEDVAHAEILRTCLQLLWDTLPECS